MNTIYPIINHVKCDGDAACTIVCPNNVFSLRKITDEEYNQLPFVGKLKTKIKGRNKSFVTDPESCIGCNLCVTNCHEKAITLSL
ncbi:MAG: ferredoxin family protein [Paludibacter sp.]|nr:ferredoxin family protein [Paludibacter sp.]